jgi:hypothetical protein
VRGWEMGKILRFGGDSGDKRGWRAGKECASHVGAWLGDLGRML